jgi:O-antigen/teichoic acid export membrane protein
MRLTMLSAAPWQAVMAGGLVFAGRGASGLIPVAVAILASRAYGLTMMGEMATALAAGYAVGEVADAQSQRHVTRVSHDRGSRSHAHDIEHFTGLRVLVLLVGLIVAVALFPVLGVTHFSLYVALSLSAIWVVASNTFYATALADARFAAIGFGPWIALLSTVAFTVILGWTASAASAWTLVAAIHLGRFCEFYALVRQVRWPGLAFTAAGLMAEWSQTRYLMLLALASAAHARLVIPFTMVLAGATVAGAMTIGLSLLSAVSVLLVAITVPAYRQAVARGSPVSLRQALASTQREFVLGVVLAVGLTLVLWSAAPKLVSAVFHVEDAEALSFARIVVLASLFEGLSLFAGIFYHACYRDRLLFWLSFANALAAFAMIALGSALGGSRGLAWGFTLSRALGAGMLYAPFAAPRLGRRAVTRK